VVETIRLESGHTLTGIVGSNPTLSAILLLSSGARAQPTVPGSLSEQLLNRGFLRRHGELFAGTAQ
jgi:hypothetical protein